MGIVNQVRSFFRGREKVNVLTSLSLEIIPSTTFSDTKVLP